MANVDCRSVKKSNESSVIIFSSLNLRYVHYPASESLDDEDDELEEESDFFFFFFFFFFFSFFFFSFFSSAPLSDSASDWTFSVD